MGDDELTSDEQWVQETLDSDEEVKLSKQRMLSAAMSDKGEVPALSAWRYKLHYSKGVQLARKALAAARSKNSYKGYTKPSLKSRHW